MNHTYGGHESLFFYNKSMHDNSVLFFRFGSSDCSGLNIMYCIYEEVQTNGWSRESPAHYFLVSYIVKYFIRPCLEYFYEK